MVNVSFGSFHWKIPGTNGNSEKVVPFLRLEFPNGMSCSIYVSRSLYQFQVHRRAPRRTGVYDQMEQLFTNRKFHFCSHRNLRVFFPKWKAPQFSRYLERSEWIHVVTRIQSSAARQYGNFRQMVNTTYRPYRTKIPNRNFQNFVINDSQYSNLR